MRLTKFEKDFVQKCVDEYEKHCVTGSLPSISQAINGALAQMNLIDTCPSCVSCGQDPSGGLAQISYHCAYCSCGHINSDLNVHECVLITYGDTIREAIQDWRVAQRHNSTTACTNEGKEQEE